MSSALKIENLWKQYRLGTIGHGTLRQDMQSWWARLRGKEDPNLPISRATNGGEAPRDRIWALKDVSLEIKQGEVLGIIGRNGAGKSTLFKIISRVTAPTKGRIMIKGKVASLLEVGTGFHHELTGRENIFLNGAILGMTVGEIRRKFDEIVEFSGVERFIDTPVKRYSSGMYVRLAFAVAAHLDPEILVVDEVLAVGDADFQKKCLGKMGDVAREGRTVLIISHNLISIVKLCARAVWLDSGKITAEGDPRTVVGLYAKQEELPLGEVMFDPPSGQGGVALKRSWVMNGDLQKYASIPQGENFYVALEYEVKSEVRGLMVGFMLRNEEGLPIFRTATTDCPDLEEIVCRIGQHRAWVEIPGNLLSPGRYYTELGLWTQEFKHHFYMEKAFAFNIMQDSQINLGEILRPILNWQVT